MYIDLYDLSTHSYGQIQLDEVRKKGSQTSDNDGNKQAIDIPRDREGEFTPKIIPKGLRLFAGFDDKVISLYA